MTIMATAPVPAHSLLANVDTEQFPIVRPGCPPWCSDHRTITPLVDGDRPIESHASAERMIEATITDLDGEVTQTSEIRLQIEQYEDADGPTPAAIFLSVAGDTPMTAATARELAVALVALADQIDGAR